MALTPRGHSVLHDRVWERSCEQVPPHVALRVTFRVRRCVPPVPQADWLQESHELQEDTAQFLSEQEEKLQPSDWSSITVIKTARNNQSNLDIVGSKSSSTCRYCMKVKETNSEKSMKKISGI